MNGSAFFCAVVTPVGDANAGLAVRDARSRIGAAELLAPEALLPARNRSLLAVWCAPAWLEESVSYATGPVIDADGAADGRNILVSSRSPGWPQPNAIAAAANKPAHAVTLGLFICVSLISKSRECRRKNSS